MNISRITPKEAFERLRTEDGWVYLDVRSTIEFEKGHAPNSVNIPLLDYSDTAGGLQPNPRFVEVVSAKFDNDKPLIVACAAGGRSLKAAKLLSEHGYSNIVDMLGGFSGKRSPLGGFEHEGWAQQELPVEEGSVQCETYQSILSSLTK